MSLGLVIAYGYVGKVEAREYPEGSGHYFLNWSIADTQKGAAVEPGQTDEHGDDVQQSEDTTWFNCSIKTDDLAFLKTQKVKLDKKPDGKAPIVAIIGRPRTDAYINKQSGKPVGKLNVNVRQLFGENEEFTYLVAGGTIHRTAGDFMYSPEGKARLKFSVVFREKYTDSDGLDHNSSTWTQAQLYAARAEGLNKWIIKGAYAVVAGRVKTSAYLNAAGEPRASIQMNLTDSFSFGPKFLAGEVPANAMAEPDHALPANGADMTDEQLKGVPWDTAPTGSQPAPAPTEVVGGSW